jgi:hypothetical protein
MPTMARVRWQPRRCISLLRRPSRRETGSGKAQDNRRRRTLRASRGWSPHPCRNTGRPRRRARAGDASVTSCHSTGCSHLHAGLHGRKGCMSRLPKPWPARRKRPIIALTLEAEQPGGHRRRRPSASIGRGTTSSRPSAVAFTTSTSRRSEEPPQGQNTRRTRCSCRRRGGAGLLRTGMSAGPRESPVPGERIALPGGITASPRP